MGSVDCHLPSFSTKWIASWSDKPQFVDLKIGAKAGDVANVTGAQGFNQNKVDLRGSLLIKLLLKIGRKWMAFGFSIVFFY
jgi:hypothetical protein